MICHRCNPNYGQRSGGTGQTDDRDCGVWPSPGPPRLWCCPIFKAIQSLPILKDIDQILRQLSLAFNELISVCSDYRFAHLLDFEVEPLLPSDDIAIT